MSAASRLLVCIVVVGLGVEPGALLGQSNNNRPSRSAPNYPAEIEGAEVEVYKTIGDVKLNAYIFRPKQAASEPLPAIVFFFGGGWRSGSPTQFEHHCRYLADRGMVAMTMDYRVQSRHDVKAVSCVTDAKSAIRWVRKNASRLGVDPERIVAAGGSAGGHLAACTGTIRGLDESDEPQSVSSIPNAMALFNPALVLAAVQGEPTFPKDRLKDLAERMGIEPEKISPYHQLAGNAPPTIIFHGQKDTTVPYRTAEIFAKRMQQHGNRCELVGYPGQGHGFFNFGRGDGSYYDQTVDKLDVFLVSLGYLSSVEKENP